MLITLKGLGMGDEERGMVELVKASTSPAVWVEWTLNERAAINGDVDALRRCAEIYEAERVKLFGWPLREAC